MRQTRKRAGSSVPRKREAMALLHIPLNQIEEQHILELIPARAPETNIVEYKRETYGNALRDDLEFLAGSE